MRCFQRKPGLFLPFIAFLLLSGTGLKAQELTENNAALWGTFASDSVAASVTDSATRVKVGSAALHFTTLSGFDTGVIYPKAGNARLNLTGKNFLKFWAYAINNNSNGFQGNQPVIVLKSATGSYRYEPAGTLISNRAWRLYMVPLAGSADWTRTATGTPNLADINQIEIHQDTWDYGFSIDYDGMEFISFTPGGLPPVGPNPPPGVNPNAIEPKILLYIYDPIMTTRGGRRMHTVYGWQDPVSLTNQIISDFKTSSHDLAHFKIAQTQIDDTYPYFQDGYQYNDAAFAADYAAGKPHQSTFDYVKFIQDKSLAAAVDRGDIDEVWVYSLPYGGMWESAMAGNGAYWINGPSYPAGERAFAIMGWNFERGVGEAIHSFGHRAENIMVHSYGPWQANQNTTWNRFALLDKDAPGKGGVGNVHFPVNGTSDYDYYNPRSVVSNADDWNNYPNFTGVTRSFTSAEWSPRGADPQREYLNWWYSKMPHVAGRGNDFFLANWWRYLTDIEQFKSGNGNLYFSDGIPAVTTVPPLNGAVVTGIVTVQANATVNGALGRVDLYIDGVYNASDTLAPYTFAWNTAGLTGTHTLQTKAYELQNGTEAVSPIVTVTIAPPTYQIAGTLALDSISALAPAQPITFTLRKSGAADLVINANVKPDGLYSLVGVPAGSYTIHIKGPRYLAKNVSASVTAGNVSGVNAALRTGDANNDNTVDVLDFGLLVNAYGSDAKVAGSGYDPTADFNYDGVVDVLDFGLLVNSYGLSGDK